MPELKLFLPETRIVAQDMCKGEWWKLYLLLPVALFREEGGGRRYDTVL